MTFPFVFFYFFEKTFFNCLTNDNMLFIIKAKNDCMLFF